LTNDEKIAILRAASIADPMFFAKKILGYNRLKDEIHRPIFSQFRNRESLTIMPRGTYKSTAETITGTLWNLIQNPNLRIALISATNSKAVDFLREIKGHIERNEMFRFVFGDWINRDRWTNNAINIAPRTEHRKEASITAIGMLDNLVSSHYDIMIIDDPVNQEDRESQTIRERKIRWIDDLNPLLDEHTTDIWGIQYIGTTWHFADLWSVLMNSGRFIEGKNFIHKTAYNDDGSAWFPEALSVERLEQLKASMSPAMFSAHYLCKAVASEDRVFRNLHYYTDAPNINDMDIMTWVDPAMGKNRDSCLVGIVTIGRERTTGNMYLLKVTLRNINAADIPQESTMHMLAYNPQIFWVENNGAQDLFVSEIRNAGHIAGYYGLVEGLPNTRNKEERMESLAPMVNDGALKFPQPRTNDERELITQFEQYPVSKYVDGIDAVQSCVARLIEHTTHSTGGVFAWA